MLAGLLLCLLHTIGLARPSEIPWPKRSEVSSSEASRCPQDFIERYAGCQARQDFKVLLSCLVGATADESR